MSRCRTGVAVGQESLSDRSRCRTGVVLPWRKYPPKYITCFQCIENKCQCVDVTGEASGHTFEQGEFECGTLLPTYFLFCFHQCHLILDKINNLINAFNEFTK